MTDLTMSQFASKDDLIAAQAARIAELEAELEAVGAGGVQSLRKQAAQGLEQFIEQAGEVHFQRCRVGSATGAIRWDIEFGYYYGSEVSGKTLQEAIEKAIAAQAKQGEQA